MTAPQSGDPQQSSPSAVPINQDLSRRRTRSNRSRAERTKPLRARSRSSLQTETNDTIVHALQPKARPLWLLLFLRLQQTSSVVAFSLAASVLAVYGWTVYIQQHWSQSYAKLEALQKQERQLVSANEVLKNQMAEQAENPTAGLLLPDPSNAIFLTPAPQRPAVTPKPIASPEGSPTKPLGY